MTSLSAEKRVLVVGATVVLMTVAWVLLLPNRPRIGRQADVDRSGSNELPVGEGQARDPESQPDPASPLSPWVVVVEDAKGTAVPGSRVALFAGEDQISSAITDSTGSAVLRVQDLPPQVTVLALEALPNSLRFAVDDISRNSWSASGRRHGIRLPNLSKIQFRVRSLDGKSAPGVRLQACALPPEFLGASQRTAFLDVAGAARYFSFTSTDDGSCGPLYLSPSLDVDFKPDGGEVKFWRIESSMSSSGALRSTYRVGEADEYYVEFKAGAAPSVEIQTVGQQGEAMPRHRVWLWYRAEGEPPDMSHFSAGGTGSSGHGTVDLPLWNSHDSALNWWACTWGPESGFQYHRGSAPAGSSLIELRIGGSQAATEIRGRFVEAEDSSPVPGAPVHLMINGVKLLSVETTESGVFQFTGVRLPPASWEAGRSAHAIQFRVGTSTSLMLSTESWYRAKGEPCPDFFAGIEVFPDRDAEIRVHAPARR